MPRLNRPQGLMPELIGHRGLPLLAPENTQASIECAAKNGISWVELDVTMLGDQSLIMMHDPDLRLFKQADIKLVDLDARSIKKIDAGSWFSKGFSGEPLIDLTKTFSLISNLNLSLNLEIKINPDMGTHKQVDAVYSEIIKANMTAKTLIVSSFNHDALIHLRTLDSDINIALLFEHLPQEIDEKTLALNPASVHCNYAYLNEQDAGKISQKFPLYCFTVNDTNTFEKLLSWGVSGIYCDRAHAKDMLDVVKKINK